MLRPLRGLSCECRANGGNTKEQPLARSYGRDGAALCFAPQPCSREAEFFGEFVKEDEVMIRAHDTMFALKRHNVYLFRPESPPISIISI
jgi:hypothetical protein